MDWLYPLSGFVVGALVGLTGMGGGSLMTPLLILLFGVHPLTAVGTDLLFAATTKTAGTAIHSKNGNVDWRVVRLLAARPRDGWLRERRGSVSHSQHFVRSETSLSLAPWPRSSLRQATCFDLRSHDNRRRSISCERSTSTTARHSR